MLDNVLGDAIDKRIMAITNSSIVFTTSNGDPVDEIEELMMSDDFELMLTEIMNSKFWGITVLEFDFTKSFDVTNIPRKQINALTGDVLIQQSDLEGYPYRDDPFFLEAGKHDDLGLILRHIRCIYKRGGFGDWEQFADIVGTLFRKVYITTMMIILASNLKSIIHYRWSSMVCDPQERQYRIYRKPCQRGWKTL